MYKRQGLPFVSTIGVWGEILSGKCFKPQPSQLSTAGKISNIQKGMKEMAKVYGYDISEPAKNAHEAFQWLYFGYLAAICFIIPSAPFHMFLDFLY